MKRLREFISKRIWTYLGKNIFKIKKFVDANLLQKVARKLAILSSLKLLKWIDEKINDYNKNLIQLASEQDFLPDEQNIYKMPNV